MKKIMMVHLILIVSISITNAQQKREANAGQSKSLTTQSTSVNRVESNLKIDCYFEHDNDNSSSP